MQTVQFNAPIRQMKLEFAEPEETFLINVEKAEKLLAEQQRQIDAREDLGPVLQKHKASPHCPRHKVSSLSSRGHFLVLILEINANFSGY